jgi:hypothetical protein
MQTQTRPQTRAATNEDVGNIVALEHVNVTVPDQTAATLFYIVGMGFTRDPYLVVGLENMWVNVGEQQFHLPGRGPQVIPGHIGVVVPDLAALQKRLEAVAKRLAGTQFRFEPADGHLAVTCPWGNQLRCYAPRDEFGDMALGIPYVEFQTRPGTAEAIARFYREVLQAPTSIDHAGGLATARVQIGTVQALIFRETDAPLPPYDGHHVAIYIAHLSGAYTYLAERDLLMQDLVNHQFRFKDLVDPDTGAKIFELEHEVRSLHHPLYGREFVNRNPDQSIGAYTRGADALNPARQRSR